ncbi:DUF6359 domain-containing protein [Bacillus sp. FJAT-45037]|uniref:DUF6359 domain-containing protein n=1 Tax=Bacillus sp. FJAT-45037 TaxID=2011007 RepID=UPI001E4D1FDE|nr:DUF6359 domain-containing protein [Bacillus sp. FJAT-45037]
MNFKFTILKKSIILFLSVLIITSSFAPGLISVSAESSNNELELSILYTNDIHSSYQGFGKASAYIKSERAKVDRSLYLDAGDIFSGDPVVDLQYGKPLIEVLNLVGVDAMVIGNHEFDYGQAAFAQRMEESNFPWLAANMKVVDSTIPIQQTAPYQIFELDGVKVGVLAITEAPPSTSPTGIVGLEFESDYAKVAREYKDILEEKSDVVIALTHIGHPAAQQLARDVDYFDLIIGAHTHTTLITPDVVNGTPIVQAGANLDNVGKVHMTLDPDSKQVTNVNGSLQRVSQLTDIDQEVQDVIDYYEDKMQWLNNEIGFTQTGLTRNGRYNQDAPLGNFWTDAIRDYTNADAAITNNGGIRDNIATGPITKRDIYTVEPFANEIMIFEMTGHEIKEVLTHSYNRRNQIDLQISGIHYEIVTNLTNHLVEMNLTHPDGTPLDLDQTFKLAVPDYIGTGGGGYRFNTEDAVELEAESSLMTDAMIEFAKKLTANGQDIDYRTEGRIQISVDPTAPAAGDVIGSTERGLYSANKELADVGIGNLYTDAIRTKTDSDIALLNGSSVGGQIPAGSITDKQIEALDQFDNQVVKVETTGARIKEVILSQSNHHGMVDLQASGIEYTLYPKSSGGFDDATILLADGSELDPAQTYTVAYNDFMHGRGFYNLGDRVIDTSATSVWKATIEYIQNQDSPVDYNEGDRIRIDGVEIPDTNDNTITVGQAIANNTGTKEVRGYIVGSINSNQVIQGEDGHAPSNLLLADHPEETDRAKMLPVQLGNGTAVRNGLNLVNNPDNLGTFVTITGSLETYFQTPGMQAPTAYAYADPANYPDPSEVEVTDPEVLELSIAEVRTADKDALVETQGIVTSTPGAWGQKGFYLQDDTAGIYVFQNTYDVEMGDEVKIKGTLGDFNGELQVTNLSNLEKIGTTDVPAAKVVTTNQVGPENEGQLIQLQGVTIENIREQNFGTVEFDAVKDGEKVVVRIDNRTGVTYDTFVFNEGDVVTVTGASSQFRGTPQLKPRFVDDVVEFDEEVHVPKDYLTVAEAIANNEGTATVRGFIVGTMTGNFEGNFVATNLMLADDPNEREMSKVLPVQLPNNAIRTALNLADNPENLGKQIEVTGDLTTYFTRSGLQRPTGFEFIISEEQPEPVEPVDPVDPEPTPDPEPIEPVDPEPTPEPEEEFHTIADAIAAKGEFTFKGYVVGNVRSRNHVAIGKGFYNDHNLLVADSPDETDRSKMILVDLKGKERSSYGLISNPSHLGQEIIVTGNRDKQHHSFEAARHLSEIKMK